MNVIKDEDDEQMCQNVVGVCLAYNLRNSAS